MSPRSGLSPLAAAFVAAGLPDDGPMSFDQLKVDVAELPPSPVANDTAETADVGAYEATPHVDDGYALRALPHWVVDMIGHARNRLHTPLAMNIGDSLAALSCAIQGRVRPVSFDDYVSHSCIFTTVVAEPGERKTSAHKVALAPIKAWVEEQQDGDTQRDALEKRRMDREFLQAEVERLEGEWKTYGKDPNAPCVAALREARIKLESAPPPVRFKYLVQDVTPEKLVDLLATHGRLALVSSDADVVFKVALGRYNKGQASIGPMIQAYDGDKIEVERIGRDVVETQHKEVTLSAMLSIQPSVLDDLTGNTAFVGQGFAARIMWIVCDPAPPRPVGVQIPQEILDEYDQGMRAMLALPESRVMLAPDAAQSLKDWHDEIEHRSRTKNGDLNGEMQAWASKHVDRTLRIAACLWAGDAVYGEAKGPITHSHMTRAIRLARWLIPHAVRALQGGNATSDEAAVLRCLERRAVKAGDRRSWVTRRELAKNIRPKRLNKEAALSVLLRDLAARGAVETVADMSKFRLPA